MQTDNERVAYLAQIANLFYREGKTEADIAAHLGLPVSEVAGLLNEARQLGVVSVDVRAPWKTDADLEERLKTEFHLKGARVLVRGNQTYEAMLKDLGLLGAQVFQAELKPDAVIGISWGSALYQMIQAIQPARLPNVEVVQMIGASGAESIATDGPILAQLLTNRLGARCFYLHAPLIVESETGRAALLKEQSIRSTLNRIERVDLALVGIGTTDPARYSLLRAGYVNPDELEQIQAAGAVGDVCAQHFNQNGEWLNIDINRRGIGVRLDTLQRIPTVIGIAGGSEKTAAILGALRGQYVNVLITDDETARQVLALHSGAQLPAAAQPAAPARPATRQPLVSLKGIWKVFSGVPVLRGVDIDLLSGEIHALLGGNGSGKSTLMKILSGIYTADAGSIELNGTPVTIQNPAHAHQLGVYLVPQEPKIFQHMPVIENLLIGSSLKQTEVREQVLKLAQDIGFEGSLDEPAGSLNIANQQIMEIMRGLIRNAQVLIFDEPTSTLTFREVESLFQRMRLLKDMGIGIFFISHRLNEILTISERVSVLRDGQFVLNAPTAQLSSRDLIRAMLPDSAESEENGAVHTNGNRKLTKENVLEVNELSGQAFRRITLRVRGGEVVGLAGLVGAGRTELAMGIFGLDSNCTGKVLVSGKALEKRSPRKCLDNGLVYVPEDRHAHGIFLDLPHLHTTSASILKAISPALINFKQERQVSERYVQQLQIKANGLFQVAKTLSGGNQQKVVLSKCLASNPRVVILDEPTRGVDAKARQDVYRLIEKLTEQGVGVLLISSDLEEVVQLSDRILVMHQGVLVDEFTRPDFQMERITAASFGLKDEL